MSLRRVSKLAVVAGVASSVTACGGQGATTTPRRADGLSSSTMTTAPATSRIARGHSEAEVLREIAAARAAEVPIRYVVIRTTTRDYVFPLNAQVVRTDSELVVRAYKRMYVWPLNQVRIYYSGASSAYDMSRVPLVHAPDLDRLAAVGRVVHVNANSRMVNCADCDVLLYQPLKPVLPDPWVHVPDPWQGAQSTVAVQTTGALRQPRFSSYGSGCDVGWTCYYGGYGGYTIVDPGTNQGGGGVSGSSGQTGLQGNPCQVGSVSNAATQKAAMIKAAGNAYAALGATNPIFNNTPANASALEYYGFIYTNGPSYMFDGPYALTLDGTTETGAPGAPGQYDGWIPVGIWHTHPGYTGTGNPTGVENGSHFSAADISYSNGTGLEMFVGEHNSLNADDTLGATRWYSRDPKGTQDSAAQAVGSGGC